MVENSKNAAAVIKPLSDYRLDATRGEVRLSKELQKRRSWKKAPGEYSWRGEDKNVSPPEQLENAQSGIDSSSKLQKISFTQITLLDKSSVDQSGDSCAKQRIFNGFYGASYTIPGLRPSFG